MFQPDDSTILVYNLFGLGSMVNVMFIHEDGTMTFPGQALFYDSVLDDDFCNYTLEGDSLFLGNSGLAAPDTISWAATMPCGLFHGYSTIYDNNRLYFTDGSNFDLPVTPVPYLRGDANNSGEVSIADVTTLINALLSSDYSDTDTFGSDNADCNQDGRFSIADVTTLINYLLSGNWPD